MIKNGTTLQKYQYSYGQINTSGTVDTAKNKGQLAQVDSWIGTTQEYRQQFKYDCLNRLLNAKEKYGSSLASTAYEINYEYDPLGNRYQKSSANSGNSAIAQKWVEAGDYDLTNNRFQADMAYDEAGNIIADPRFRDMIYGYDANGRQDYSAQANGSSPVTVIFDGAGQKVATKASGYLSVSVYDAGGKLAAEYAQTTAPTTTNVDFVTNNYQGSTAVVTDNGGLVKSRHDYLPFGEELNAGVGSRTTGKMFSQSDSVRQKYAGMETDDATGLNHTLWRKDDNWSGRWTSPDPYGGSMSTADPQSFNRYAYCSNDPVNHVDLAGLSLADIGVYQTEDSAAAQAAQNHSDIEFREQFRRKSRMPSSPIAIGGGGSGGAGGGDPHLAGYGGDKGGDGSSDSDSGEIGNGEPRYVMSSNHGGSSIKHPTIPTTEFTMTTADVSIKAEEIDPYSETLGTIIGSGKPAIATSIRYQLRVSVTKVGGRALPAGAFTHQTRAYEDNGMWSTQFHVNTNAVVSADSTNTNRSSQTYGTTFTVDGIETEVRYSVVTEGVSIYVDQHSFESRGAVRVAPYKVPITAFFPHPITRF